MAFATPNSPLPPKSSDKAAAKPSPATAASAQTPARAAQSRQIHQHYRRAQVETATPTQLIILLYDGAIRFGTLAREAIQGGDLETQHTNLLKTQRILTELMSSLDRKAGGAVADNLFQLYAYMLEQLVLANLHDKADLVDGVLTLLRDLRESWLEVDRMAGQSADSPAPKATASPAAAVQSAKKTAAPPPKPQGARLSAGKLPPVPAPVAPPVSRLGDRNA